MKPGVMKALVAASSCAVLAGCATTVDMGGPLGHYRYHYDAGVAYTTPRVIYRDDVTYREPAVVYREPVTVYRAPAVEYAPAVQYRTPAVEYRAPAVEYRAPAVVYRHPAATTFSYYDHKR